jgi:hypothetical protein
MGIQSSLRLQFEQATLMVSEIIFKGYLKLSAGKTDNFLLNISWFDLHQGSI